LLRFLDLKEQFVLCSFSKCKEESFPLVFYILPDEFPEPGQGLFVPALGVEVEHGVGREAVGC
jgi:hypothetical protein